MDLPFYMLSEQEILIFTIKSIRQLFVSIISYLLKQTQMGTYLEVKDDLINNWLPWKFMKISTCFTFHSFLKNISKSDGINKIAVFIVISWKFLQ